MGKRFRYTGVASNQSEQLAGLRHLGTGDSVGRDKPRKYRNIKTCVGAIVFDSKREAERYQELRLLVAAGKVKQLELQPKFLLACGGKPVKIRSKGYPNGRRSTYKADFRYWDEDRSKLVVEDVKGYDTTASRLRRAVVEAEYGIQIEIVR
jgi:hypothetical protein